MEVIANPVSDCHTRIIICAGGGGGANDIISNPVDTLTVEAGGGLEGGRGGSQPYLTITKVVVEVANMVVGIQEVHLETV